MEKNSLLCQSTLARPLGSCDAWQAMIEGIHSECPDWSVIFVPECDGELRERECGATSHHTILRHWPGMGSLPMAVIIRSRIRCFLRSHACLGRSIRINLFDKSRLNLCLVFLHGGHGDNLEASLADAALLAKGRPRCSQLIIMGDFNVDQLPVAHYDPGSDAPDRMQHHRNERVNLAQFANSFGLDLALPEQVFGSPGGQWNEQAAFYPLTQCPVGQQHGLPSLLDYTLAVPGDI